MQFFDRQLETSLKRGGLYKGNERLFSWVAICMFFTTFVACIYVFGLDASPPMPDKIVDFYAQQIPSGIKIYSLKENSSHSTEFRQHILNIGAFFCALVLFGVFPFFLIWTGMLIAFVKKNTPFVIPAGSGFTKRSLLADNIKLFAIALVFALAGLYTFIYDYESLLIGELFIYIASLGTMVIGLAGMLFSVAAICLLYTNKKHQGEK